MIKMEERLEEKVGFFKRKDIEISVKRYVQDALSAMAMGLFASLLIGLIFKTIGEQTINLFGENAVSAFLIEIGGFAMSMMGPAIGVAVAWALKAPLLVLASAAVSGYLGATLTGFGIEATGGPAGAFIAVAVATEFGKMVSKETKVDILVTPSVSLLMGGITAGMRQAIIVFPHPGFPFIRSPCFPAAAMMTARLACSCPMMSPKSGPFTEAGILSFSSPFSQRTGNALPGSFIISTHSERSFTV